jgi:hypothetical protein
VDILCLIPIHIAIARDNRFIPLKDGVFSVDMERSLLGARVEEIIDSISFGWYESIFRSYMTTKVSMVPLDQIVSTEMHLNQPVKVVSSMGMQIAVCSGSNYSYAYLMQASSQWARASL